MQLPVVELAHHLAFLVSLCVASSLIDRTGPQGRIQALAQGILFGGLAALGILNAVVLVPGLILDGRSVLLSLVAYFFGPWAAMTAALMAILARLFVGGVGTLAGVLVILSSVGIGLYLRTRDHAEPESVSTGALLRLGLGVHVGMLVLLLATLGETGTDMVVTVALPVLLFFPAATLLGGKVLSNQILRGRFIAIVRQVNADLASIVDNLDEAVVKVDPSWRIERLNPVAEEMTGWSEAEARLRPFVEVLRLVDVDTHGEEDASKDALSLEEVKIAAAETRLVTVLAANGASRVVTIRTQSIGKAEGRREGLLILLQDVTRERRAQEELRRSEERLRLAISASRQGLWDMDVPTGRVVVDEGYATILGHGPQTFQESMEAWTERLHPDDRERVLGTYEDFVLGRTPNYRCEFRLRSADGAWIWVLSAAKIVARAEDGKPLRMIGTHVDIMSQKQVEEVLRTQHSLLTAIINSDPDLGVYSLDREGRYTLLNEKHREEMQREWGVEVGVGTYRPGCIGDPDLREREEHCLARVVGGDSFTDVQYDAKWEQIREVSWSPIVTPDGAVSGGTVFVRDVTDMRRVHQQVRLQSAALNSMANSVVITNSRGSIEWVNPAFCRVTGYSSDEVLGENPRLMKSGRQSPEYYADMWRTISSGRSWRGQFVNRRKNGEHYTEDVTVTPVRNDTGEITHYVAVKQDVSELKRNLAELGAARAELAERNDSLRTALAQARSAVKTKAAFLATMSHELRTPMNGVVGMTSILMDTSPLSEEQQCCIETIRDCGQALLDLITSILDFTKIEADGVELRRVPFEVRDCVDQVVGAAGPLARGKGLGFEVRIDDPEPGPVLGDPDRLRQVIRSLIGNAIKFTAKGQISVEARVRTTPSGHRQITVQVRDSGVGIPAEHLGRLFDPFFLADSSDTRSHGGAGLGLAIGQRIAHAMGGGITVLSEVGRGSVFSLEVLLADGREGAPDVASAGEAAGPARPAPAVAPANRSTSRPDTHRTALPAGKTAVDGTAESGAAKELRSTAERYPHRILLVEDNPINQKVALAILRRLGYTADVAADGVEAIEACRSGGYDLVFMDVQMPRVDGLEATREVRRMAGPQPKIVAMTAKVMPGDREACLSAGMDDYLAKPVKVADFQRVVAA